MEEPLLLEKTRGRQTKVEGSKLLVANTHEH